MTKHSDTRRTILEASLRLCKRKNYSALTMNEVADAAEVTNGTIVHHFLTMEKLKRELVRYAVETGNLRVIGQAVVNHDKYIRTLSREQKNAALSVYMG